MDDTPIHDIAATLASPVNDAHTPQELVNACLKKSKALLTFVENNAALALAVLEYPQLDISPFARHLFTLTAFAKLNHFNDHFLQHIVAAHVAAYYWQQSGQSKSEKKAFVRFLFDNHLTLWRHILSLQKVLFNSQALKHISSVKLNSLQRFALLASVFTYAIEKHTAQTLISYLTPLLPTNDRHMLNVPLLIMDTPLPGSRVYYKAHPAVVVDLQKAHVLISVPSLPEEKEAMWVAKEEVLRPRHVHIDFSQFIALHRACELERTVRGGGPFFAVAYAIQKPPLALLTIIDTLQKADIDINALCEQVERTPAFSHFLMSTASQDNRLRLPVTHLKQAILTYGLERVGDMLIQFALMERLTQHTYPLLSIGKQFTHLSCAIASQLVALSDTKLTPQSASLLTTFVCAPLFTLPGLKVASQLPVSDSHYFQIHRTFKVKAQVPWHTVAGELAANWHQGATWRALIHNAGKRHHDVPNSLKKEHAIIQLAFGLAREALFPLPHPDEDSENTKSALLRTLSLSQADITLLLNRLSDYLFCPFPLTELN